jgi:2,4-diketo-3-deoxy-L-fuconate hydrolase
VPLPIETPRNIVCIGLNDYDHAQESGLDVPLTPMIFAKWPTSLVGSGEPIVIPDGLDQIDYEAELAVVIDREARDVDAADALGIVRGYVCFNDVSARRVQAEDVQWTRGKSFDSFGPIGPRVVPASEIPDPQNLAIYCRVNGVVVQESNTKNMIFSIPQIIEAVSRATTLMPGDIIATGTPGGVGSARRPQVWLNPGDVVEVEIEGIGVLSNSVVSAGHGHGGNSTEEDH